MMAKLKRESAGSKLMIMGLLNNEGMYQQENNGRQRKARLLSSYLKG
jgi:hypothetical protein